MADQLEAEQTPGFKVGEKKTMEEYQKLGRSFIGSTTAHMIRHIHYSIPS